MPNPKDWFRRRRAPAEADILERDVDPFSGDGILDLGRAATLLRDGEPPIMMEKRGPIPPPPTALPRREGVTLDRSAFAVRPEIVRSVEPQRRLENRAAAPVLASAPSPFAIRRGVTQLAPAPRPAAVESPPEPSPPAEPEP
ncbi:MAG TPA: hypothetical protein VE397_00370, partial [Stellaceae bacterium]|nr:hypothetical protein [Stellaceae bacterium]